MSFARKTSTDCWRKTQVVTQKVRKAGGDRLSSQDGWEVNRESEGERRQGLPGEEGVAGKGVKLRALLCEVWSLQQRQQQPP